MNHTVNDVDPARPALGSTSAGHVLVSLTKAAVLAVLLLLGTALPAVADTVCTGDTCVVTNTVSTPAGSVTVTVTPADAVTVALVPIKPDTVVVGLPFTFPGPPVSSCPGGCAWTRTTIPTAGGTVNVDTILLPPGPPNRFGAADLTVISIHPPNPCRVQVTGTTVTFTPATLSAPAGIVSR